MRPKKPFFENNTNPQTCPVWTSGTHCFKPVWTSPVWLLCLFVFYFFNFLIAITCFFLLLWPSSVSHVWHYSAEKGENSLEISQKSQCRFENKRNSDLLNHSQALYPLGYTSSLLKWNYLSRKKDFWSGIRTSTPEFYAATFPPVVIASLHPRRFHPCKKHIMLADKAQLLNEQVVLVQ